jgi:hypothetical protein
MSQNPTLLPCALLAATAAGSARTAAFNCKNMYYRTCLSHLPCTASRYGAICALSVCSCTVDMFGLLKAVRVSHA